ncbi:hypothetical protein DFQ26_005516 [Actinomortierella ambigua]|nr:hypothetical protein DFQ26_005516 [Actinomortierella ambigua]
MLFNLLVNIQSNAQPGAIKVNALIVAFTASLAYLAIKVAGSYCSQNWLTSLDIPTVALKTGATTHDQEYRQDPQAFMLKCEQEYGSVYNVYLTNELLTIVSGPDLAREFYFNKDLSFSDAVDKVRDALLLQPMIKSNKVVDNMVLHWLVRDLVTPKLHLFMPSVVRNMEEQLDIQLGYCDRKLIKEPVRIVQKVMGYASK